MYSQRSPLPKELPFWGVAEMHTSHGEVNELKDSTIFQFRHWNADVLAWRSPQKPHSGASDQPGLGCETILVVLLM